ncbi:MAG: hypothetical protein NTW01_05560 [Gammaproteobacteria bacterium]|nr:hypothetical protein [Gammaproteobacteria bacterium]
MLIGMDADQAMPGQGWPVIAGTGGREKRRASDRAFAARDPTACRGPVSLLTFFAPNKVSRAIARNATQTLQEERERAKLNLSGTLKPQQPTGFSISIKRDQQL